ncbi:hypothetical protein [Methanosphaera sp.]|jgi:hypothetical protein|uniref:hypothetical protein n=1 Tax=Methanosphaera sp. TaxID=2666342 RepID=UPI003D8B5E79
MQKEYWKPLVEIIDLLTLNEIIALYNYDKCMIIITKYYDQKQEKQLNQICYDNGLEWDFMPYVNVTKLKSTRETPCVKYIFSEEE